MAPRSRAYGPYKARRRWRILIRYEGRESAVSYETKAEAVEERDRINRRLDAERDELTIDEALDRYERYLIRKGNKASGISTTMYRLRDLFFEDEHVTAHAVRDLTETRMRRLYEALAERRAVDTHRNTLGQARTFIGWCVDKRYVRRNTAAPVQGIGRRKRGKPQLRINEARKFTDACLADMSPGAVGALCTILLGLRASEVVRISRRDVDADGHVLWIPDAKTEAGRRTLQVPDLLAARLEKLADGLESTALLFTRDRHWLARECRRLCRVAGVPERGPHGLRGSHASLVAEQGITGHVAAHALGHSSYAVTKAHYVDAGAAQRGQQAKLLRVLDGGKSV